MSLMRYGSMGNPWFDRWMDLPARMFRDMFGDLPNIDLEEHGDRLIARIEVPGVDPDKLEVIVHENTLTVRGEWAEDLSDEAGRQGRRQERFSRTITLPQPIRAEAAEAHCRHGVLRITMPLQEPHRQGHRIPIRWQEEGARH